jgi:hypothetical protein
VKKSTGCLGKNVTVFWANRGFIKNPMKPVEKKRRICYQNKTISKNKLDEIKIATDKK